MPRRSIAELAIIGTAPASAATRLRPPATLSEAERVIFLDIITACRPQHFHPSDAPLLHRYVEAIALSEQAALELRNGAVVAGKCSPWLTVQEKTLRAMVALSMRLRLSPQSRSTTSPTKAQPPGSYYDRMNLDDDR